MISIALSIRARLAASMGLRMYSTLFAPHFVLFYKNNSCQGFFHRAIFLQILFPYAGVISISNFPSILAQTLIAQSTNYKKNIFFSECDSYMVKLSHYFIPFDKRLYFYNIL